MPPNDTDDAAPSPDTLATTSVISTTRSNPFVYHRPVLAALNVIVPVFDVAVGVNVPLASDPPATTPIVSMRIVIYKNPN